MTGVSKFTKLSVFSGMNNLTDISMSENYASLLGYTRDEVERNFKPHIKAFADKLKTDSTSIVEDLMSWYDSYRFSPECETRVSNPVSIGRALQERRFYGFWDATGSATLIVERLRKLGRLPDEIEGIKVFPKKLDVCDVKTLPFAALMYQGGYLTINDARQIVYVGVNYDTRKRNVDTLNDTLNDTQNDTLNDTLNSRLVALVRQCSGVRRPELMAMLGVSESTVARCLRKLQSRVEFRGAAKTGGYYLKGE